MERPDDVQTAVLGGSPGAVVQPAYGAPRPSRHDGSEVWASQQSRPDRDEEADRPHLSPHGERSQQNDDSGHRRKSRDRSEVLSVSIVGYTNAGKSTLFNKMTHANVYAADQLFATLDTTARRVFIEGTGQVVLSDTVGFIRHLPHGLVAAFRSTLEETAMADLLLHVVDANSLERHDQVAEVNKVLHEIGADKIPQILIYNKIDLQNLPAGVKRDEYGRIVSINLSAKTGAGIDDLRSALAEVRDAQKDEIQVQEWHPLNN